MSFLTINRQISDDIWEFSEWLQEKNREFRGVDKCPTPPDESEDDDEFVTNCSQDDHNNN